MVLVTLSHLVNLVVVTLIPILIARDAPSMRAAYGPDSPARRILACLYATIALASGVALAGQAAGLPDLSVRIAGVLFPVQITYKLLTVPVVGWASPVVRSNVAIAVLHAGSLAMLWSAGLWPA
jgi:hypothetical protein